MTIEHVVVLMLENRSFDCMLGDLYPSDGTFEGLTGQEFNSSAGRPIPVWSSREMDESAATIPDPDPGELFADMNEQLFSGPPSDRAPSMSGFAENYARQKPSDKPFVACHPMHFFRKEQVPVITTLARAFAVCDQWHASAPCQTWPNRFFVHAATARGHINNGNFKVPFVSPSIFRRLEDGGRSWRVYFHDVPQSILLGDICLLAPLHYRMFDQFLADAQTGALPNYSFIEPRYFTDAFLREIPNDQHPPHNVLYGEQLIARVYNVLRKSPCWKKTLFIITYDEHGGCFDHMPPPLAVPPDGHDQEGFKFDRYGVRVPAVIISPFIPAGTKIRSAPQGLPHHGPPYPFDHTSIIATLRKIFDLGPALTARDAVAPDLVEALSLRFPSNDGPDEVQAAAPKVSTTRAVASGSIPTNSMQTNLVRMAASLSARQALTGAAPMVPVGVSNVATAHNSAVIRIRDFLGI